MTTKPNIELFEKALNMIKANPEHWNQAQWHCETSHCFAGFCEIVKKNIPLETTWLNTYEYMSGSERVSITTIFEDPSVPTLSEWVADELGLNEAQAHWLFSANREVDDFEDFLAYAKKYGEWPVTPNVKWEV